MRYLLFVLDFFLFRALLLLSLHSDLPTLLCIKTDGRHKQMSEIDKMKMSLAFSLISLLRSVDVLIKRDLFSQLMHLFYLRKEVEQKKREHFSRNFG